jgi:hypothetical protein
MKRGILWLAFGDRARAQCLRSMETARQYAPHLPHAVISTAPLGDAQLLERPEADIGARTYKTQLYSLSPFEETLYLDADTELVAAPTGGFQLLQFVDLVLGQDCNRRVLDCHWRNHDPEERAVTLQELPAGGDVLYYNSGVLFFKRHPRVAALFAAWHTEWQRWGKHDQLALARALYTNPVRIATIRENWNTHVKSNACLVYHKHRTASRPGAPQ